MSFWLVVGVGLAVLIGVLVLLGRLYPGDGSDLLDWQPERRAEQMAALEAEDSRQMLDAHNARRAREGRSALSRDDVTRRLQDDGD